MKLVIPASKLAEFLGHNMIELEVFNDSESTPLVEILQNGGRLVRGSVESQKK